MNDTKKDHSSGGTSRRFWKPEEEKVVKSLSKYFIKRKGALKCFSVLVIWLILLGVYTPTHRHTRTHLLYREFLTFPTEKQY